MRNVVFVVALALCLIFGSALVTVLLERKSLRTQLSEFHDGYLSLSMEVETLKAQSPEARFDRLQEQIEAAQSRLASTNAKVMAARAAIADAPSNRNEEEESHPVPETPSPAEDDPAMREMSAILQMESEYAGFFAQTPIAPEVAEKVRAIFKEAAATSLREDFSAIPQDEEGFADIEAQKQRMHGELRAKLSGLLSGDQMAAWEQYELVKPRLMMEQRYDVDLAMYAPGLSPENRALAKVVFAEEMLREEANAWAIRVSDVEAALSDPKDWVDPEGPAMKRAAERLQSQLDAEQFDLVAKFVEQQNRLNRITMEVMHL